MKKILIVGASSCIGSNLAAALRKNHLVYGTYARHRPLIDGVPLIKLFLQPEAPVEDVVERLRPDYTIYCVSQSNFLACEADPESTLFLHEDAAARMANACNKHHGKFIYLSTSKVFSGTHGRYSEDHDPDPICVYGSTKLDAEQTLLSIGNSIIFRLGTVFGFGGAENASMLPRILDGIWNSKREYQLVSDEYRTFTCVSEIASVVEHLFGSPRTTGVFHLGNSERNSYFSFATKLAKTLNLPADHLRPVSGKSFVSNNSRQQIRGSDLTLVSTRITQAHKYRFNTLEESLDRLKFSLSEGYQ